MDRKWFYHPAAGAILLEGKHVQEAEDSADWFDTPDDFPSGTEPIEEIVEEVKFEFKQYSKSALSRMNEERRVEVAVLYEADISNLSRKEQIAKILTLQAEHDST